VYLPVSETFTNFDFFHISSGNTQAFAWTSYAYIKHCLFIWYETNALVCNYVARWLACFK